jgi:hypothetical protein
MATAMKVDMAAIAHKSEHLLSSHMESEDLIHLGHHRSSLNR